MESNGQNDKAQTWWNWIILMQNLKNQTSLPTKFASAPSANVSSAINGTGFNYDQRNVYLSSEISTERFVGNRYKDNSTHKGLGERPVTSSPASIYLKKGEPEKDRETPKTGETPETSPGTDREESETSREEPETSNFAYPPFNARTESYRASEVYAHAIGQLGNDDDPNDIVPDMLVRMKKEGDGGLQDNLKLIIKQADTSRLYSADSPLGGKSLEDTKIVEEEVIRIDRDEGEKGDSFYRKLIAGVHGKEETAIDDSEVAELRKDTANFVRMNPELAENANQALENDPLHTSSLDAAVDTYRRTPHENDPVYTHIPTKRQWLQPLVHLLHGIMPAVHNAIKGEPLVGPLPRKKVTTTQVGFVDSSKAFHFYISQHKNLDRFIMQLDSCLEDAEKREPLCYVDEDPVQLGKELSQALKQMMELGHTLTESETAYIAQYVAKHADIYSYDASANPSWGEWIKSGVEDLWNKLPNDPLVFPGAEGCTPQRNANNGRNHDYPVLIPAVLTSIVVGVPAIGSFINSFRKTDRATDKDYTSGSNQGSDHTTSGSSEPVPATEPPAKSTSTEDIDIDVETTTDSSTVSTSKPATRNNLFPECKAKKDSLDSVTETSSIATTTKTTLQDKIPTTKSTTAPKTAPIEETENKKSVSEATTTKTTLQDKFPTTKSTTTPKTAPIEETENKKSLSEKIQEAEKTMRSGLSLTFLSPIKGGYYGANHFKTLLAQKGLILFTLNRKILIATKKLNRLETDIKKRIKNENDPITKGGWEILIKAIEAETNRWLKFSDKNNNQIDFQRMETALFEIKEGKEILELEHSELVEQSQRAKDKVVPFDVNWNKPNTDLPLGIDHISDEGSPELHNMLCNPVEFFNRYNVLPTSGIGKNKNDDSLKMLKLVKIGETTFFVQEADTETDENYFIGMWFDGHAKKEGDLSYLDLPKNAALGTTVFTDVISHGSIILTDYNDHTLRLYHDPHFGRISDKFDNIINSVTALDYKRLSTDPSSARVIIFKDHEGWKTLVQTLKTENSLIHKTRRKRALFPGVRAWIKASREMDRLNARSKAEFNKDTRIAGIIGDMIYRTADQKGRTVIINTGNNYHSALLVYDNDQKGPVLISSGDDAFDRSPSVGKTSQGISGQILFYGFGPTFNNDISKNENIVIIDGLDTKKMIDSWKKNLNHRQYSQINNNCAQVVRDVLFSGMEEKDIKNLKKNVKLLMPLNLVDLANEIKETTLNRASIEETDNEKKANPNPKPKPKRRKFSQRFRFSTTSQGDVSVDRPSSQTGTSKTDKSTAKKSSKPNSRTVKTYTGRTPKIKTRQHFSNISHSIKRGGASFTGSIKTKLASMNSRIKNTFRTHKGAAASVAGQAVMSMIGQWIDLVNRYKLHNSMSEHDQRINEDDLDLSTGLSFIPLFGGFIQEAYDVHCGNAGCFSEDAAIEDNTVRLQNIETLINNFRSDDLSDDLIDEIIHAMKGPATLQTKKFKTPSGKQLTLYVIPMETQTGFMSSLEKATPTLILNNQEIPIFIVTKVGDNGNEEIAVTGLGSEILQAKVNIAYHHLGKIQKEYTIIKENTIKWIRRIPSFEEVKRRPANYNKYFNPIKQTHRGFIDNPSYDPEEGIKEINKTIKKAQEDAKNYLDALSNDNSLDTKENEIIAILEYIEDTLLKLSNPDFRPADTAIAKNKEDHLKAITGMIIDSIKVVHDISNFQTNQKNRLLGLSLDQISETLSAQLPSSTNELKKNIKSHLKEKLRCVMQINECDTQTTLIDKKLNINQLMAAASQPDPKNAVVFTGQSAVSTTRDLIRSWNTKLNTLGTILRSSSSYGAYAALSTFEDMDSYEPVILFSFQGTEEKVDIHKAIPTIYYKSSGGNIVSSLDFSRSTTRQFDKPVTVHVRTDDFTVDSAESLTHPHSPLELLQQSIGYQVSGIKKTGLYALKSGNRVVTTFSVAKLQKTHPVEITGTSNPTLEKWFPDIPIVRYRFEDGFYKPAAVVNLKESDRFTADELLMLSNRILHSSFNEIPEEINCKKTLPCKNQLHAVASFLSLLPFQEDHFHKALTGFSRLLMQNLPDSNINDVDDLEELLHDVPEET